MNPERGPEIIKERKTTPETEKPLTEKDISKLAEGYFGNEKEVKDFVDFVTKKIEKMSRRDFLKIAAGTAIGLSVGYKYFEKNIDKLWTEYQTEAKGYEISYSKEMTNLYEEVKDLPDKKIKYENLEESLKDVDRLFKHAEFIKNSEKKNLEGLVNDLDKKDLDAILFGEYHGPESNAINSVKILENLQAKGRKEIAKIGLEFLDFNNPEDIDLTEKFNKKLISVDDFYLKGHFRSDIRPLLEFAQKNNIAITGLEDEKNSGYESGFKRFISMSQKVGELVKNKKGNEMVVAFAGLRHTSKENLSPEDIKSEPSISREPYEITKAEDYTFKEYLEKLEFKSAAVNLEDWDFIAKKDNFYFGEKYKNLNKEEEAGEFYKYCQEKWSNYKIEAGNVFSVEQGEGIYIYTVVNPAGVADSPPNLNVFKGLKENPPLVEIINKEGVDYSYHYKYQPYLSRVNFKGRAINIAEIDLKTGEVKKLYLPEQAKDH